MYHLNYVKQHSWPLPALSCAFSRQSQFFKSFFLFLIPSLLSNPAYCLFSVYSFKWAIQSRWGLRQRAVQHDHGSLLFETKFLLLQPNRELSSMAVTSLCWPLLCFFPKNKLLLKCGLLYNLFGGNWGISLYNPIVVLWLRFKALKLKQHEFRAWLQQLLIHMDKFHNLSSVLHV